MRDCNIHNTCIKILEIEFGNVTWVTCGCYESYKNFPDHGR